MINQLLIYKANSRKFQALIRVTLLGFVLVLLAACGDKLTPQEHLENAQAALAEGKGSEALIELRNALQKKPDFLEARVMAGRLQILAGDAAGAEKNVQRAIELGDNSEETLYLLLQSMLAQNKAEEVIRTAPIDNTPSGRTLALISEAHQRLGDVIGARETLQKALASEPDSVDVQLALAKFEYQFGEADAAKRYLERARENNPQNLRAHLFTGDLHLVSGEFKQASKAYSTALEITPNSPFAQLGLARACIYLADVECAANAAAGLAKSLPRHPESELIHAYVAKLQDNTVKAIDHARKALTLNPKHAGSQLLLSQLLFQEGSYDQAAELVEAFLTQFPESEVAIKRKAAIALRQKNPDAAIDALDVFDDETHTTDTLKLLASAHSFKGDRQKSQELLKKATELAPDDANLQVQLALEKYASGLKEEALRELEALSEQQEEFSRADVNLLMIAVQAGEVERALSIVSELEQQIPESAAPGNIRGVIRMGQGRKKEAQEEFESALSIQADYLPALFNLATVNMLLGDLDGTNDVLDQIDNIQSGQLRTGIMRAAVSIQKADQIRARDVLTKLTADFPRAPTPLVMLASIEMQAGDLIKTQIHLNKIRALDPGNIEASLLDAQLSINNGAYGQAAETLTSLMSENPGNLSVRRLLAEAIYRDGDTDKAMAIVQEGLESSPDDPGLQYLAGRLMLAQGNFKAAKSQASRLKREFPSSPLAYMLLGDAHAGTGNWGMAAEEYQRSFDLQPATDTAVKLHQSLMRAGNGTAADSLIAKLLKGDPDDVTGLLLQAGRHETQGDLNSAISTYKKIIDKQPGNVLALNNLAWLMRSQDPKASLQFATKAHSIAPDNPDIADTYGWLLVQNGQAQQARAILRSAVDQRSSDPNFKYHLAVAMAESGKRSEAEVLLRRLLRDVPDFAERAEAQAYYDKM